MRKRNRLICLLAALSIAVPAAAVPATAFGQSAGDDQYVDPFQDNSKDDNGNSGSQADNSSGQQTDTSTNGADTAGTTAAQNSATDDGSLPRTGEDLGGIALIGVMLLGGGLALRRAWPHPE